VLRRNRSVLSRCAVGLVALVLTACGGSQQSLLPSAAPPKSGGSNANAAFARVTVIIKLPRKAVANTALRRRPLFVSPSIASATVTVSATGSPTAKATSNVVCSTATPPSCTVTATILAPVQNYDTFTVVAYDRPNGAGNVLSQGSTVYPVSAGQNLQVPIVLQGIVASILAVNVANATPLTGTSATSTVLVSAADADGNVIAGQYLPSTPGQPPVTLQLYENDGEGLFSFAGGGTITATATLTSSTVPATVYLRAKADVSTPDDVTIIATLPNAPFVPGTSAIPATSILGEITTQCPPASPFCVFYPTGYELAATQQRSNDPTINPAVLASAIDNWDQNGIPGTPQDAGGGNAIWNVTSFAINRFDLGTDTFANVSVAPPPVDFNSISSDIAGSFWGQSTDAFSAVTTVINFATTGAILQSYPPFATGFAQSSPEAVASSLDAYGQLWSADFGLSVLNPATGVVTTCSFEPGDANFGAASFDAFAVSGQNVWVGVAGAVDQNVYVFKVPAQVPAAGCDLTKLETPSTQFNVTGLIGSVPVSSIQLDAAGNAYVLQITSVAKISPAGVITKLVDTGTNPTQTFLNFAVDPSGSTLYLLDFSAGLGTLDKVSAATPSANPLPSVPLPAVLDPNNNAFNNPYVYRPFFASDGNLWIGSAQFANPALPFTAFGSPNIASGNFGGLVRLQVTHATFAAVARQFDAARFQKLLQSLRTSHRRLTPRRK